MSIQKSVGRLVCSETESGLWWDGIVFPTFAKALQGPEHFETLFMWSGLIREAS